MGLIDNKFESDDNTVEVAATVVATTATPAVGSAVATFAPVGGALVTSANVDPRVAAIDALKDAERVEFNSLPQIKCSQGKMSERESSANLGEYVTGFVVSYQDSWIISTGDNNKDKTLLRFSNDGITCTDGTPVQEHVDFLRNKGFSKARSKQRSVVVMLLTTAEKDQRFVGESVQFDLAPSSKTLFDRYIKGVKSKAQLGLLPPGINPQHVKVLVEPRKSTDGDEYSVLSFATAPLPN